MTPTSAANQIIATTQTIQSDTIQLVQGKPTPTGIIPQLVKATRRLLDQVIAFAELIEPGVSIPSRKNRVHHHRVRRRKRIARSAPAQAPIPIRPTPTEKPPFIPWRNRPAAGAGSQ